MRSKKVIALLISLTLLVSSVLPGTLAVSIDQDTARSSVTLTPGEQETPTPAPEEQQEQEDQNKQKDQNEQENICTCGSTDGTHAEDCPLYEAPKTLMTASAQTAGNGNYAEGHERGYIRIKINVYRVDENGQQKPQPDVPVEVRRLLSNAYATKGWKDQLVLFTGTSDENGVVYIEQPYTYVKDTTNVQNDTVYLGDDKTNDTDHIVYQQAAQYFEENVPKNNIRFDINPASDSRYNLNWESGKIRKCTSGSNGGAFELETEDGLIYDDLIFHDGLGDGDGQENNSGGAYIVFDLYVQEKTADIQYNIVDSENGGTLSSTKETLKAFSGSASGSTPTAKTGYQFVGWYKDEACTQPVDASWVNPTTNQLIPQKENLGSSGDGYKAATYYAKFTPVPGTYELKLQVKDTTSGEKPYVLVDVTGPDGYSKRVAVQVNAENETSIYGLQSGTYTCTVVTGWSWRYGDQSASVTMDNESVGSVTLSIHQENSRWLDGNAYRKNTFSN